VKSTRIAVSGKGGVGKTFIAGALAHSFAQKGYHTMAIDADPSPNLALTLGLSIEKAREILPISENKELLEKKTATGYDGVYRLSFTVDDIIKQYAVQTPSNVSLIVMGTVRSMGSGCTCPANAVIRSLLSHMIIEGDEVVILDTEAGVEHMGRGTARHMDVMLAVTDANIKSLETAKYIHKLASDAGMKRVRLVGNKIANAEQRKIVEGYAAHNNLSIACLIPYDQTIAESEIRGQTPLGNEKSEALKIIEKLREKLGSMSILQSEQNTTALEEE
jgi:CO dehydrogenase maturation factor